jgi:hypothetical protein
MSADEPMPDVVDETAAGRRWLRVVPGAVLVLTVLVVVVRAWSALVVNHIAYPLVLLAALAAGVWLLASGLRRRPPARAGGVRLVARVLGAAAAVGVAAMLLWLEPFVAEPVAVTAWGGSAAVPVDDSRTATVYEPATAPTAGLVLVPGARVDPRAYAVLASRIAEKGFRVVVLKCPFDLALLCPDAPSAYVDGSLPWAVGGHSLGGVVAAEYAATHPDVDGLVLWASYPLEDMSGRTGLAVTTIGGSEDALSTPEKIDERMPLLPPATVRVEIPGGIHSFFGDYGLQPGDGTATTTREQAQDEIVTATVAMLERISAQP